jgi:hypothetical protein
MKPNEVWDWIHRCSDCAPKDGALPFGETDIAEVLFEWDLNDDWDTEVDLVARLADGRAVVISEWADSSGHG